jgi:hypothetical protein
MAALLDRTQTSTGTAALVGAVVGLAVVGLYMGGGLVFADWSLGEFRAHLSANTVGYLVGMIALGVAIFGVPIAGFLRFNLIAPLVVLAVVVFGWLTLGAVQGLLSFQTVFGLALYATFLSPIYLLLYGVLGGSEYLLRTRTQRW